MSTIGIRKVTGRTTGTAPKTITTAAESLEDAHAVAETESIVLTGLARLMGLAVARRG